MPYRTPSPVITYDEAGRVVDANEEAADLLKTPLGRLRGMHVRDFYHPDDLPTLERWLRTSRSGEEIRVRRWMRCCNGRYRQVDVKTTRRLLGGFRAEYVPTGEESADFPGKLPADDVKV
jgi:PAS domain S-box-containing protein